MMAAVPRRRRARFGRPTHLTLAGILPLASLLSLPLMQEPPEADHDGRRSAQVARLRERLREGPGPVRVIVFGDSLTAGWGPADAETEGFPAVFGRALKARYPNCEIELIAAGGPGDPSEVGLIRLENEVIRRRPDVVVIQFGGNDQRLGRQPRDLADDLIMLVESVRDGLPDALSILATPPMDDTEPKSAFVRAVLFAARSEDVPVADFDRALRDADRDFRGPFCWGGHPGGYGHLVMARELLHAWDRLLGLEQALSVEIEGYSEMLRAGERPRFRVSVRNHAKQELSAELEYGPGLLSGWEQFDLQPDATAEVNEEITIPSIERTRRTRIFKLRGIARAIEAEASDIDTKWLSIAPVVVPDEVGDIEPEELTWHEFGVDSLVKGDWSWQGDEDLSARFAVALQPQHITFIVDVTDNDLDVAKGTQAVSERDSVELCLDLRPPADQGKPVYSEDVLLLIVKPGTSERKPARWQPLDDLIPRLVGVSADSELKDDGYAVWLTIPRRVFARPDGEGLTGIGFDVHVNDSDYGLGRERQMVWAGTEQNYLNPSAFAALAMPSDDPPILRASLR